MRRQGPFGRRRQTAHIQIKTSVCEACGDCVEACPEGVLRVIGFWGHRHAKVNRPDLCQGCGKCLRACTSGAITARPESKLARRRVA